VRIEDLTTQQQAFLLIFCDKIDGKKQGAKTDFFSVKFRSSCMQLELTIE
jgi:hypothetical protein